MTLKEADIGTEYKIRNILTSDGELRAFLFTLGCYDGADITLVARRKGGLTVLVRNGRYSIDNAIAETILV